MQVRLSGLFSGLVIEAQGVLAEAVKAGVGIATEGLKTEMRQQIMQATTNRAGGMIGSAVYPKRGPSLGAAGSIYARGKGAADILDSFSRGVTIRSSSGLYLAVPTDAVPKSGPTRKRITPADVERIYGARLRFVYRQGQPSLLVIDNVRVSGTTGRARSLTSVSRDGGTFTRLRGRTSVVAFVLVPQVKMPKLLDTEKLVAEWAGRIPALIDRAMPRDGG